MTDTPQLHAQLAAIEARFRQRLDDELDTLDELSAQLQNDPGALRNLRDRLHKLAGSAGTFGYGELGSVARQLEQQAQTQLDADSLDAAVLTKLSSAGAQLRPLLQRNEQREAQPQQLDAGISDDDRHRRIGLLM